MFIFKKKKRKETIIADQVTDRITDRIEEKKNQSVYKIIILKNKLKAKICHGLLNMSNERNVAWKAKKK